MKFKILRDQIGRNSMLRYIPWSMIAPYEKQAYSNHGQSLSQLNERGGLSVKEAWLVLNNKSLKCFSEVSEQAAEEFILKMKNEFTDDTEERE